jgi:esterase/lipase
MSNPTKKIKRPSLFLFLTEIFRAIIDSIRGSSFIKNYQVKQKGDGHTVLVIPGFLSTDKPTKPLRHFLDKLGYKTYGWGMGRNLADLTQLALISKKIDQLYEQSGEQISLIGWSLGGVYARQLAKEKPEKIRQLITLGSPFNGINEPNNATLTFNLVKWLKGYPEIEESFFNDLPLPAPVPTTAIYSKKDGIVPWESCMEQIEDATHQNIEVTSSHLGMGTNKDIMHIIAHKISLTRKNWHRYGEASKEFKSQTSMTNV